MIIYRDGPMNWIAERDTGEKISLTYNEIQDIYWFMRRERLWEEVILRMEGIDANDAAGGTEITSVEKKKDSILNYIMEQHEYRTDDVMGDIVWDAIAKFCPDVYSRNKQTEEHAVEIFRDGKFVEQVDVFSDYGDAVALAKSKCLRIDGGEEIHITTIVYNANGDEIEHYCDAVYDQNDA